MTQLKPKIKMVRGWYICMAVLQEKGLDGVITIGRGRRMRSAFNAWSRNYNWYKRGCPGSAMYFRDKEQKRGEGKERNGLQGRSG